MHFAPSIFLWPYDEHHNVLPASKIQRNAFLITLFVSCKFSIGIVYFGFLRPDILDFLINIRISHRHFMFNNWETPVIDHDGIR